MSEKNLFCYKLEQDITESSKATEENKNCIGCVYLEVCKNDILDKTVDKKEEKVEETKIKEEVVEKEKKEKVKKEPKPKKESKPKKSTKKKKPSLQELAELEDIF